MSNFTTYALGYELFMKNSTCFNMTVLCSISFLGLSIIQAYALFCFFPFRGLSRHTDYFWTV